MRRKTNTKPDTRARLSDSIIGFLGHRATGKSAVAFEHREHFERVATNTINDPVASSEDLPDVLPLELGNDTSRQWHTRRSLGVRD